MRYRRLGRTSLEVSSLGFGASPLGNVFERTTPEEGSRAVYAAIDRGINLFDVSPYYGNTLAEERLGAALEGRREKVILATKCGRYGLDEFDFSRGRVKRSLEESLRRLRTDHVDLLQAHDVEFGSAEQIIHETIPALRELQQEGKARFIGITGYPLRMLVRIAEAVSVDTVLSYCRYNLLTTDMDQWITPFVLERQIGLINASPLAMGLLTERGAPDWHPAPEAVRKAGRRAVEVCREHGADISTLALQFCLAHPYVSSTLVGIATVAEVEKNLRASDAAPDPELLAKVRAAIGPALDMTWHSGRPENQDLIEIYDGAH
jgi:L-galactose dehydrogenase